MAHQHGVVARWVEAKDELGAGWFSDAQPLGLDGHPTVGADLEGRADAPDEVQQGQLGAGHRAERLSFRACSQARCGVWRSSRWISQTEALAAQINGVWPGRAKGATGSFMSQWMSLGKRSSFELSAISQVISLPV